MSSVRKSLVDLTLSSSGRATFKQDSYGHAHQLFVSSTSSLSDDAVSPGGLTNDVMAWAWGSGKYGRLGLGSTADASVPAPVTALSGKAVRQMAAGSFVTAFLVESGQLYMSGKEIHNLFAGTSHPLERLNEDYLSPVPIDWFANITLHHVAVGETVCAAIGDQGELYWWGDKTGDTVCTFRQSGAKFKAVACGGSHVLALTADGQVMSWGANQARQLGLTVAAEFVAQPSLLKLPAPAEHIACGYSSSAVLLSDGSVYAAGSVVGQQQLTLISALRFLRVLTLRRLACNDLYLCCVTLIGESFLYHSVPLPFSTEVDKVTRIFADLSVREVVCGTDFISCLTDSGAVHSWGRCCLQLGLGEVRAKKHVVGPRLLGSFSARFVRSLSCGTAHLTACLAPQNALREAIGWEMLETERIYFRSLVILIEVYKPALAKPRSTLGKLFAEVEAMLRPHTEILQVLGAKMDLWTDASVLGPLLLRIAKKSNIEVYTRFHRLLSDWLKQSGKFLPGGKKFQEGDLLAPKVAMLRKVDSAYERKKPVHLVGLLSEPFERIRQYFWLCSRLVTVTPNWHADYKDLASASEMFQRELSGYYSEHEMMRLTIQRLEGDKEELLKKLSTLSATNDNLFLSRNNHELQKRELTDVTEQHQHKIRTMNREIEQLRERNLFAFLEKREESIRRRRAHTAQQKAVEEAAVSRDEVKRLETELSVARSMKLFRDVIDLRSTVTEREKEILGLKEQLQKQKEVQVMQTYTDAHIKSLESENIRLAKHLQSVREELLQSIQLRHAPICETLGLKPAGPDMDKDTPLIASDGSVRGSSVQGLVSLLVQLDGKESVQAYMGCFFLTYRVFITPIELQYSLQELYCKPIQGMDPPSMWSRVLGVLRYWITEYAEDFSLVPGMKALLWGFLEETVCVTLSPATADAIMKDFHKQTLFDETLDRQLKQNRALLNSDTVAAAIDEAVLSGGGSSQAQLLAEQLIQIEFELLLGLEAKEMLGCQWLKPNKDLRSPAVVALTQRFNNVCSWAVSEILTRADVRDRREVLCMLIAVASRARALGAFNTTMELVAALNKGAVQRLKKTWELVPRKDKALFDELEEFVSSKGSYKLMREGIRERRDKSLPVLPYIGMYLADLVYTDEGSMVELSPGVINFGRLMAISAVIQEVLAFKKTSFNFAVHAKLRSYLVSCTVLGEDEAWEKSSLLEPRVADQ